MEMNTARRCVRTNDPEMAPIGSAAEGSACRHSAARGVESARRARELRSRRSGVAFKRVDPFASSIVSVSAIFLSKPKVCVGLDDGREARWGSDRGLRSWETFCYSSWC